MTQHKHADVLRAIAEGKRVQLSDSPIKEEWTTPNLERLNPLTRPDFDWRIDPDQDVVLDKFIRVHADWENISTSKWGEAKKNVRFIFSASTGELKSVEMIK